MSEREAAGGVSMTGEPSGPGRQPSGAGSQPSGAGSQPSGAGRPGLLLERVAELATVEASLDAAAAGAGSSLVVAGPPGIGKTSLLAEAAARAEGRGFRVLRARPGHLEKDLAWSVARDLFGRALAPLPPPQQDSLLTGAARLAVPALGLTPASDLGAGGPGGNGEGGPPARAAAGLNLGAPGLPDMAPTLYGLYWLCSNLAQLGPVLVMVDDAHWADPPSARMLSYLAERVGDLPVLLALGVRAGAEGPVLAELARGATVAQLAPLSSTAGTELVRRRAGTWAGEDLCRACHHATGGNPFLLHELAGELAHQGRGAQPGDVARLKPETVTRTVLLRLARLPAPARRLAMLAAVLGHSGTLGDAVELLGLPRREVCALYDVLVEADILRRADHLELAHPLVGEIIYQEWPVGQRSELHAAAARLRSRHRRPAEDVAAQLLGVLPAGDTWVVAQLRGAAEVALGRAAPQVAASYLRRALAEQVGPPDVDLLVRLAVAESAAQLPGAVERLLEAHGRTVAPEARADLVLMAAPLLVLEGRLAEVADLCEAALEEIGGSDRERTLRLVASMLSGALLDRALHGAATRALVRFGPAPPGGTPGERVALAVAARVDLEHLRPADGGGELARPVDSTVPATLSRRALGGGRLLAEVGPENPLYWYAATSLMFPGWYGECADAIEEALAAARARGSVLGFAMAVCFRSQLRYRQGRLGDSVEDARLSLSSGGLGVSLVLRAYATAFLVNSLLEMGGYDEAARAVAELRLPDPCPAVVAFAMVRVSAGRLAVATGDIDGGVAMMLAAGRVVDAHGTSAMTPWRAPLAVALAASGDRPRSMALAHEELDRARAGGSPWALTISLRAAAIAGEDIGLLEEAVAVATGSGDDLELARALCDLGAMHRRAGARRAARAHLETAVELAENSQATVLVKRATDELQLCGGTRHPAPRTAFGLTPGEQRVADMALSGLSNPEIAQGLFVSLRTVETHLTHVYRKLGIDSRHHLAAILTGEGTARSGRAQSGA